MILTVFSYLRVFEIFFRMFLSPWIQSILSKPRKEMRKVMKLLLAASEMVVSCPIGTNLTLEKEVKIGQARRILESLVKSRRKRPFISPPTDAFRL